VIKKGVSMGKEAIRRYGQEMGADVVGFAAVEDYRSERSPDPKTILPGVKSMVVLGYREIGGAVESENTRIAMTARMGVMDLAKKTTYLTARFIEERFHVRAAPIALSYPLNMAAPVMGLIGDVSLRHAAVAAGLGVFGRHHLVIHPRFGTRIVFTAVLTEYPLSSDSPVTEDLCTRCGLCVESCPARALDVEGKTDEMKCLRVSQPYGIGGAIGFIRKFTSAPSDQQKTMLFDPQFLSLYQASFIGFQYECFQCMAVCPVGV
jgi:epoxyqueuosine reductase